MKHSGGKGDPQTFRRDDDEKLLHIQEDAFIAHLGEGLSQIGSNWKPQP